MVYFDTNILIYIFALGIDTLKQKDISIKLFDESIKSKNLILSEISLYEFAFSCKKLKEDPITIQKNLKFLSRYVKETDINIHKRVIEIFEETNLYTSSFDVFHLAFCEHNNCKLITFDKGFKKLQNISKIEIDIK
jgi:predicted nucleic acid-binding protein